MATRFPIPVAGFSTAALIEQDDQSDPALAWREVFTAEDAGSIWRLLSTLVENELGDASFDLDRITQDLFLELIATNRPQFYIKAGFTHAMIEAELRVLCTQRYSILATQACL
ncbi:MAG: hypothetical protein DMF61_17235 [Blastocatellia bacterium AA13]|nr:MAG: hypothetical protein DMF61_17235 [Blastocatellia bacterium AA13]